MNTVEAWLKIFWDIQKKGAPLKFWALENPVGYLSKFLGSPIYSFQPWEFGETDFRATKRTAIWGYFNKPIKTVSIRTVPLVRDYKRNRQQPLFIFKEKRGNLSYAIKSSEARAMTPAGFAKAFYKANK